MKFNNVKIESGMSGFEKEEDFVRLEVEGRFNHRDTAALVKAAPELLEALEYIIKLDQENFDNMPVCFQTARELANKAIEKAKGN